MGLEASPGTVRSILTDDAPALRVPSLPVNLDRDPKVHQEMTDLGATLADFRDRAGFGRAISAPQIGVNKRLIMFDLGAGLRAAINPEITWTSDQQQWVWDDCLSVPDLLVRVQRADSISLQFTDERLRRIRWERLPPDLAELFQHEIDHLDGVLMTDRAPLEADRAPASARADLIDGARPSASPAPPDITV